MKRCLLIALCLMLMLCPVLARAEALPISREDIDFVANTGLTTMGDYIDALKPLEFSWFFEGDATGNTLFTLTVEGGSVTLLVRDAQDYQNDEEGLVGATQLSGAVLGQAAKLLEAYWDGEAFTLIKLPRGLKLGDTKEQLLTAIGGLELAGLEADEFEEGYDETASCMIDFPEDDAEWQEHSGFDFFLKDGKIAQAQMWYYTDAE